MRTKPYRADMRAMEQLAEVALGKIAISYVVPRECFFVVVGVSVVVR